MKSAPSSEARGNALWGRGGRNSGRLAQRRAGNAVVLLALATALAIPAAGVAASGGSTVPGTAPVGAPELQFNGTGAVIPTSLLAKLKANPSTAFKVIVQGKQGNNSSAIASEVSASNGKARKSFRLIPGVAATITGRDALKLAKRGRILSITQDQPVLTSGYENGEMWRQTTDTASLANVVDPFTGLIVGPAPLSPAVAIVDSGVDASRLADFGARVVANVSFCSICKDPKSLADEEGHGTMVAGVLAGAGRSYAGVAPNAPIVALKTANADGQSLTSDVIAAADWILANKDKYGIKVANFSMAGASPTSFRFDPLDQAVERLWFNGVTVVAAAGNFGTGAAVDMSFAPGNDPFVITVGATDQRRTADPYDDTIAPWSAFGYTGDGFSKPDMVAPGRFMIMPVPVGTTIPNTVPDRVVDSTKGYMWMSGTSFSAPIVAGAAAQILARHPEWGPNEVKGALMLTANYLGSTDWQASGVGEISANSAALLDFTPPNPNEGFDGFITTNPVTGIRSFDQAAWSSYVATDAAWSSAAWASAAWGSAAWASAAWGSAAWSSGIYAASSAGLMSGLATYSEATLVE
jgi:serine protease AprX